MTGSSSSFGALPAELLLRITDALTLGDRCSLSAVNSHFRKFLTPSLFRVVKVNTDKCPTNELADFSRRFGRYVEMLKFECYLYPNEKEDDADEENNGDCAVNSRSNHEATNETESDLGQQDPGSSSGSLPRHLQELLSGQALPRLTILEVLFLPKDNFGFDQDWDPEQDHLGSIYIHDNSEDSEIILSREERYVWRSTLNQVFSSMAQNKSIRRLELLDLLPKGCSVFEDKLWTSFLGRLDEIKIELWGGDNGAGWHSNTTEGYSEFVCGLGSYFFDHLTSLKQLELVSDAENPVGCEGERHSPIPFQPNSMGGVEKLDLWNCFIDPPLLEFLTAKSGQLKTVRLIDCFSAGEDFGLAENGITWSTFFSTWRQAAPVIDELVVFNSKVPLTSDEQYNERPLDADEPDDVKAVREALRQNSHRKLFSYMYLDDKYGMVFCNEEANIEHFERGDDQTEYDAFVKVVASNRKRKGLAPKSSELTRQYVDSMMRRQRVRQESYNG